MSRTQIDPDEGKISVMQLAEKLGKDRSTIRRLLKGVPFTFGPQNRRMYDEDLAMSVIEKGGREVSEILQARLRKVEAEAKLREIQLKEKQHNLIPANLMLKYARDVVTCLRAVIETFPEEFRRRADLGIWKAGIEVHKACGIDAAAEEKELWKAEKSLMDDLKNGRVPFFDFERYRPTNHARVWSIELNRYLTKAEIVAKYGPNTEISPIDDILAEVAQENPDDELSVASS